MARWFPKPRQQIGNQRLAIGFAVLIGLSAGLMALYGRASMIEIGVAGIGGLVSGFILLFVLGIRPAFR